MFGKCRFVNQSFSYPIIVELILSAYYINKLLFDFDSHLQVYLIAVSFDELILP